MGGLKRRGGWASLSFPDKLKIVKGSHNRLLCNRRIRMMTGVVLQVKVCEILFFSQIQAESFLVLSLTVASSPQPAEIEIPENEHSATLNDSLVAYSVNNIDPESDPVPIWPLPTRVFPVQNFPKVPAGNAPQQSLEKRAPVVRLWRQARREIRGIGGGRWFVKSWIGEKESHYSSWKNAGNVPTALPSTSRKLKFLKPDTGEKNQVTISGSSTPVVSQS